MVPNPLFNRVPSYRYRSGRIRNLKGHWFIRVSVLPLFNPCNTREVQKREGCQTEYNFNRSLFCLKRVVFKRKTNRITLQIISRTIKHLELEGGLLPATAATPLSQVDSPRSCLSSSQVVQSQPCGVTGKGADLLHPPLPLCSCTTPFGMRSLTGSTASRSHWSWNGRHLGSDCNCCLAAPFRRKTLTNCFHLISP